MRPATVGIKRAVRRAVERWVVPGLQHAGILGLAHRLLGRQVLTVAMFHRVLPLDSEECRHAEREYVVGPDEFDRCLAFFGRHYSVVSLADVERVAAGHGTLPPHPLLITFDDGWRDNVEYAEPILKRHGMKATLFVNVDAIRQPGFRWWQDALVEATQRPRDDKARDFFETMATALESPLADRAAAVLPDPAWQPASRQMLTVAELGEIDRSVWEIGSHGVSHAPMTLSRDPAGELAESAEVLASWHRAPIRTLSLPHGRYTSEILARARSIYALVFTSQPVVNRLKPGRLSAPIGRIHVPSEACADEGSLARFFWIRSRA